MLTSARLYHSRTPLRCLAAFVVILSFASCGSENGPCVSFEYVNLSTPITVETSGQTSTDSVVGRLDATSSPDEAAWQAFRHFLLEDISQTGGGATWLMYEPLHSVESPVGEIGIQLAGSFQPGDVVLVTLAPSGISNGQVGPAPGGARGVYVATSQWIASSVSGTLEVVAVGPLRLRMDLLATNEPGQEVRIQGEMTASRRHYTCN